MFYGRFFPHPKIVPLVRQCGKILYRRSGHRRQYDASVLHAAYLRLQTHTHTHRICNPYCFSLQRYLHEHALVLAYT